MEKEFRTKITSMNRTLGTTIILSSPVDTNLKHFASVLIFLDHGHIWKIRSGNSRVGTRGKTNGRNHRSRNRFKKKGNHKRH